MSSPSKLHDPLFHYETHYPERLSRLHLGSEFGPAGAYKKSRKTRQRTGIRYKTQPVTFDEITEVDEEPATEEGDGGGGGLCGVEGSRRGMMGQLQAFSRSMDGLLPRIPEQAMRPPLTAPPRRHHFERPPSIPSIPEKVESANRSPGVLPASSSSSSPTANPFFPAATPTTAAATTTIGGTASSATTTTTTATTTAPPRGDERLQQQEVAGSAPSGDQKTSTTTATTPAEGGEGGGAGGGGGGGSSSQPIPAPNIGGRRQKVTAKAKKRQKAAEEQQKGDGKAT